LFKSYFFLGSIAHFDTFQQSKEEYWKPLKVPTRVICLYSLSTIFAIVMNSCQIQNSSVFVATVYPGLFRQEKEKKIFINDGKRTNTTLL